MAELKLKKALDQVVPSTQIKWIGDYVKIVCQPFPTPSDIKQE